MASEQSYIGRMDGPRGIPGLRWLRELCVKEGDRAARLYALHGSGLALTVVLSERATVWLTLRPDSLDFNLGQRRFRDRLRPFVGIVEIDPARARQFFGKLDGYDISTRADCETLARDGLWYFHVAADFKTEHGFRICDPDLSADPAYTEIINLYSEEFLGGLISWPHRQR